MEHKFKRFSASFSFYKENRGSGTSSVYSLIWSVGTFWNI